MDSARGEVIPSGSTIGPLCAHLRIRNNRMIRLREGLGFTTTQMAREVGMEYSLYIGLENLYPNTCLRLLRRNGTWSKAAQRISDYHGVSPWYLWPDAVRNLCQNRFDREISEEDALRLVAHTPPVPALLPDEIVGQQEAKDVIERAVQRLPARLAGILRLRSEGQTLEQIAHTYGLTRERIRQLEALGLRKLREDKGIQELEVPSHDAP